MGGGSGDAADDGPMDDEAVEVHQPRVATTGRQPTEKEVEAHLASGHAQHRSWCDSCMRARGIAGRHERQPAARPDADPQVCLDYCYMKFVSSDQPQDDE